MSNRRVISVFVLTMINLATILSIRNLPITAQYGLSSMFFLFIAMIFFFIPAALVSAELATGWPKKGGVFAWVKEALGHRMGFLASWLLWAENIVWYPTILSFVAATLAYAFNPAWMNNEWYMFVTIVVMFFVITKVNLFGMKLSGVISSVCTILGTIIPMTLIILLGIAWVSLGHTSQLTFSFSGMIPKFKDMSQIAFLAGIMLSFCGIEMSAVHANDVQNPQKNYPRAIFLSSITIIVLTVLGTIAICIVTPINNVNLVSGSIDTVYYFLNAFGLGSIVPLIAIAISIGAIGSVSTWVAGPCRGLLAAAEDGDLPPILHRVNKHGMPSALMIAQLGVVVVLSTLFIFMPSISSSFWILTVLTSQLYMIMYIIMFISGIVLRYKQSKVRRVYKIPFGNVGMWVVSGLGILGAIFTIAVGFFPPTDLGVGNLMFFESFLIIGILVVCAIPMVVYSMRTKKWLCSNNLKNRFFR